MDEAVGDVVLAATNLPLSMAERRVGSDGGVAYVWELEDGERVESMYFHVRADNYLPSPEAHLHPLPAEPVVCISSQTGCNVGCRFCATGLQPAKRNLTVDEIVGQVAMVRVDQAIPAIKVHFAGMGEPLMNYDAVVAAADRLLDSGLAARVTLVTTGIPELIRRLAHEPVDLGLYISLHATSDDRRTRLIPTNKKYPMHEVLAAAAEFARVRESKVRIAYLLLPGVNASLEDADDLAALIDPEIFHVQLLLWNPIEGLPFTRIQDDDAIAFCTRLHTLGIPAHVSRSVGREVEAACGQMATRPPTPRRLAMAQAAGPR